MSSDLINASFEILGGLMMWRNVLTLFRDKGYRGVSWWSMVFFTLWGVWNIWYYPSLNQTLSAIGAGVMTMANISWVFLATRYGHRK